MTTDEHGDAGDAAADPFEDMPHVCGSCFAVGDEPCQPWCDELIWQRRADSNDDDTDGAYDDEG